MKIKDIINNIDKSEDNRDDEVTWNLSRFCAELDLSCSDVVQDINNVRLKCYWIANHLCTDTYVGFRAYFIDDEFVAISVQHGRKCDEIFEWLNEDSVNKVRNYIISLQGCEYSTSITFIDMEEDFGDGYPIEFTGQCLKKSVMYKNKMVTIIKDSRMNYTNFYNITVKHEDGTEEDIDVREILVPWYLDKDFS